MSAYGHHGIAKASRHLDHALVLRSVLLRAERDLIRFEVYRERDDCSVVKGPSRAQFFNLLLDCLCTETVALPTVGPLIEEGTLSVEIPARSFSVRQLSFEKPLGTGAYLLGSSVTGAGPERLALRHIFSALEEDSDLVSSDSRIALNASTPELDHQL